MGKDSLDAEATYDEPFSSKQVETEHCLLTNWPSMTTRFRLNWENFPYTTTHQLSYAGRSTFLTRPKVYFQDGEDPVIFNERLGKTIVTEYSLLAPIALHSVATSQPAIPWVDGLEEQARSMGASAKRIFHWQTLLRSSFYW